MMSEDFEKLLAEPEIGGFHGPHELHVTTRVDDDYEKNRFFEVCGVLGVKAHVIYNETPEGDTTTDYLTGSDYDCTSEQAYLEMERIASNLRSAGLSVVRKKIETTPWHPLAPQDEDSPELPGSYFESHFTLPDLPITHDWKLLQWEGVPFYISTTDSKRNQGLLFATMRYYDVTARDFCQVIDELYGALSVQVAIDYPAVEFAMYDSNPDHDKEWINAYKVSV